MDLYSSNLVPGGDVVVVSLSNGVVFDLSIVIGSSLSSLNLSTLGRKIPAEEEEEEEETEATEEI